MSQSLRVLVVDDEKINRRTTVQQLKDAGYVAEAVENVERRANPRLARRETWGEATAPSAPRRRRARSARDREGRLHAALGAAAHLTHADRRGLDAKRRG